MLRQYRPGDIVSSTIADSHILYGVVKSVSEKTNKVLVAWSGGSYVQHDPDEISLFHNDTREFIGNRNKSASRRAKIAKESVAGREETDDVPPDFVGDPKVHGIDEPRGGGFSIMQTLQDDLRKEEEKERTSSLRSRRAMYWGGAGRTYRLDKREQDGSKPICCPKCKEPVTVEPFTRQEKLYSCPGCGFKVPSGKVITEVSVPVPVSSVEEALGRMKPRRGK
jgi:ribosomal protein L37AE/L43A